MRKDKLWDELRSFPKDQQLNGEVKQEMLQNLQSEALQKKRQRVKPSKPRKPGMVLKRVSISFLSLAVLFIAGTFLFSEIQMNQQTTPQQNEDGKQDNMQLQDADQGEQAETPEPLEKEDAIRILREFKSTFNELYQRSGDDQKVTGIQSLEEVKKKLETIMSAELAQWFTDSYFREQNGEVYVVAMDGPTWLQEDVPFDLEELSSTEYKVHQERDNELLGHRIMTYVLVYDEDHWIVDRMESENLDQ
ncbi:hypothetical protein GWK91_02280 [Virgibacillus sp. MSP4-1]|uniref:hypothetical protein n=1 Tax=Virgibacillus sp. MSP4-1 TaxID=2700081 RepID=UPI000399FF21|nr:hypothetical protein [Virgibacillus sp. MSP4-1]QHS21841.1 hypothetical protein GWK91_02280 [Virgibacillus sp. MSP4-1]